jgi:hypothetical protein
VTTAPQPPVPAPTGWIRLTVQGSVVTNSTISPRVRLNGHPVASSYGQNVFAVPPGRWHVDVDCTWMRTYGQAAIDLDVAEGQTVDAFYGPPYHQFTSGRIGLEKQRRPGLRGLALVLTAPFVLLVLLLVLVSI